MTDTQTLDATFRLVHALKRGIHQRLDAQGLGVAPMHVRVLKIIQRKQPCTAQDVVQFLRRDKGQVTRLLNGLIEQGVLAKEANPADKRSQFLVFTEQGQAILDKVAETDRALMACITEGLSEEELKDFQRIAHKMTENLEQDREEDSCG